MRLSEDLTRVHSLLASLDMTTDELEGAQEGGEGTPRYRDIVERLERLNTNIASMGVQLDNAEMKRAHFDVSIA